MPTPTDVLDEDIKELKQANREVVEAVRRVADSVHSLELAMVRELGAIRGDMRELQATTRGDMRELQATTRGDMRELQATTRFALKLAAWGIGILAPVVITLISFAFWAAFRAGEVNNRLSQLEQARAQAPAVSSSK